MKSCNTNTDVPQKLRNHDNIIKRQRCLNYVAKLCSFLFTSLAIFTVSSLFILYSGDPFKLFPKQQGHAVKDIVVDQDQLSIPKTHNINNNIEQCDLFEGKWVWGLRQSNLYSNSSCITIPETKNCFASGRKDMDFLNWKWKPNKCDLPSFNAKTFLEMVRGKIMAFIGDSVARNHIESLLCLLSPEDTPLDIYKDFEDRFREWHFPSHNFTLKVLWTKFLIQGNERTDNGTEPGTHDLYLDKIDNNWSQSLTELDYIVISSGHWFFRVMYLHEGEKPTACVYCNEPNVTVSDVGSALRMAVRAALSHVNRCSNCKPGLVTVVRTFAPAHFEGGVWNRSGYCNRTGPLEKADTSDFGWEMRNIQVEEVERARKDGVNKGRIFGVVDITRAMLMRPDGHPGTHWPNKWMHGYSDCTHWCLPGPVDYWNDFLQETLSKEIYLI